MPGAGNKHAWERVLAAVEADAARAAALLAGRDDADPGHDTAGAAAGAEPAQSLAARPAGQAGRPTAPADDPPAYSSPSADGIPVVWRLPTNPDLTLPDLTEMPPIPPDLREHIEDLRDRIEELQADLARALQLARARHPDRIPAQPTAPGYIDCKL